MQEVESRASLYYPKKRGPFFLLELEPKLGSGSPARFLNKARHSNSSEL
jgi:hypothetical protein